MAGEMRKIAAFLDIPIDESKWDKIVYHCTFDYMKHNATLSTPLGGAIFDGGAEVFVNQGTNGRWKDILTPADVEMYEQRAVEEIGKECAYWLANGRYVNKLRVQAMDNGQSASLRLLCSHDGQRERAAPTRASVGPRADQNSTGVRGYAEGRYGNLSRVCGQ